jgi:hypothetical protein
MKEKLARFIANRLPIKVVYYTAIRLGVYATCGKYGTQIVPELTFMDALRRWEEI